MAGKVKTHWVQIPTHAHPSANDVDTGTFILGSDDGLSLYMTNSSGVTTVVGGSAATLQIDIPDNTGGSPGAFRVFENTNDYLKIDTTDGAEVLTLGNASLGTTNILGNSVSAASATALVLSGVGNAQLKSTGAETSIWSSTGIRIGQSGQTDPIYIGSSGARQIQVGALGATETRLRGAGSRVEMNASGLSVSVKDGEEFAVATISSSNIFSTDYGANNGTITVGDVANFASQDLVLDVREVQIPGQLEVTGTSLFTATATFDNDIILNDGGSLKEGGGTAAFTFDGDGHVTKIGQSTPGASNVLQWDGAKAVWGASPAAGASTLTDLTDVGDVSGAADDDLLQFNTSSGEWENNTLANVLDGGSLSQLGDVNAPTPVDTQVLAWDNGTGRWINHDAYSDADAIAAVEGEATLDLTGVATSESGTGTLFSFLGGGAQAVAGWRVQTDAGDLLFPNQVVGKIAVQLSYRYDVYFSGRVDTAGQTFNRPIHLAVLLRDSGGTTQSIVASVDALSYTDVSVALDGVALFNAKLSFLILPDPSAGVDAFVVPTGTAQITTRTSGGVLAERTTAMIGYDSSTRVPLAAGNSMAVPLANTQTFVECGFMLGSGGSAHTAQANASLIITGAWMQAFPGGVINDPDGANGYPT